MTNKMKAIVATGYGSPEVLQFQEVNKPEPKKDEVLVKVIASAATTAETMMRTGKPYFGRLFIGLTKPKKAIPGTGFAGIIEAVGAEVKNFKIGNRIFGETLFGFGANAEYLTVSENGVVLPLPDSIDFSEVSNFCDGLLTSFNFLKEIAQVQPNQEVLINGASGALGTAAIQITKYFEASVTAVCSTKNIGLVKSLGADTVINYQEKDFSQSDKKYDFVYDAIGASSFQKCKNILKEEGVYLSPVLKLPLLWQMIQTSWFGKKKAVFAATGTTKVEKLREMLQEVFKIYQEGKLKTIIDRQFPLEKLSQAHQYIDSGRKKGNVVIYNS